MASGVGITDLPPPTLAQLVRHAQLYGTAMVYETAERYLAGTELVQLNAELTRIDGNRRRRFQAVPRRKRMSAEQKAKTALMLFDEGLPTARIAKQLGVGPRYVARLLKKARESDVEATQTGLTAASGADRPEDI